MNIVRWMIALVAGRRAVDPAQPPPPAAAEPEEKSIQVDVTNMSDVEIQGLVCQRVMETGRIWVGNIDEHRALGRRILTMESVADPRRPAKGRAAK